MQGTRHRSPMAPKLIDHLRDKPLRRDASAWLAELMAHEDLDHRLCAVRIIETRKVLACEDEGFDYDWMRREAVDGTREDGLTLRRAMLTRAHDAGDRVERASRCRSRRRRHYRCIRSSRRGTRFERLARASSTRRVAASRSPRQSSTRVMPPSLDASSTRADDGATADVAARVVARAATRPLGRGAVALATASAAAVARELARATTPTAQFASYAARVVWLRKARRRRGPLVAACACAGEMVRVNRRDGRTVGSRRKMERLVVAALATTTKGLGVE